MVSRKKLGAILGQFSKRKGLDVAGSLLNALSIAFFSSEVAFPWYTPGTFILLKPSTLLNSLCRYLASGSGTRLKLLKINTLRSPPTSVSAGDGSPHSGTPGKPCLYLPVTISVATCKVF